MSADSEGATLERTASKPKSGARVPLASGFFYYAIPFRRRTVLANIRRAFPEADSRELAKRFYTHMARSLAEVIRYSVASVERRAALVRVENQEAVLRASESGRGVLILTGHLGNWELASVAGISQFPEYRGRFHVLRRPLPAAFLDRIVANRFRKAGLGVLAKERSLDQILDRLADNDAVVFIMDQHASGRDGVRAEFFGQPAWTFRSLALVALTSGAPVVPMATWREAPGRHVLRFEEALETIDLDDAGEAIRTNTQLYNDALERLIRRHPEQWIWMHRRWKPR